MKLKLGIFKIPRKMLKQPYYMETLEKHINIIDTKEEQDIILIKFEHDDLPEIRAGEHIPYYEVVTKGKKTKFLPLRPT